MQTNRRIAVLLALSMATLTGCKEDDEGDTGSMPIPADDTGSTSGTGGTDDAESADGSGETTLVEEEGEKDCTACGNPFCNSVVVDDTCECEVDYQWKNPTDPDDFECVRIPGKGGTSCPDPNSVLIEGQCYCVDGYDWCNPTDDDDLTCCIIDGETTGG